jgi:hypothetical protein
MPSETQAECIANAAEARVQADETSLEHVRAKHLTAAAVWDGMGRRAKAVAARRAEREAAEEAEDQVPPRSSTLIG